MELRSTVVHPQKLHLVWPEIAAGLEEYRAGNPHYTPTEAELDEMLTTGGEELIVFWTPTSLVGFMTFRVQKLEPNEVWGTIAIIYLREDFRHTEALPLAAEQLATVLRGRGCQVMNYMTAREGFKRLAPKLGFRPRIIEWMKEL